MTRGWFGLQTWCMQCCFLTTSTMLHAGGSRFKSSSGHWNLRSTINIESDIIKLCSTLKLKTVKERKSRESCEIFFSQLQNNKLQTLNVAMTQTFYIHVRWMTWDIFVNKRHVDMICLEASWSFKFTTNYWNTKEQIY